MNGIKINVANNIAKVIEKPKYITTGTVGLPVQFTFDSQWDGLLKTAVFQAGRVTRVMGLVDGATVVPWEVLDKPGVWLSIGVYGVNENGSVALPTVWANVRVIQPGANPDCRPGTDSAEAKKHYDAAIMAAQRAEKSAEEAGVAVNRAVDAAERAEAAAGQTTYITTIYDTIEDALTETNSSLDGMIGTYYDNIGKYNIVLLEDIISDTVISIERDCILHLNGHKITFTAWDAHLRVISGIVKIDGSIGDSEIVKNKDENTPSNKTVGAISVEGESRLSIFGGKYSIYKAECAASAAISTTRNATLQLEKCSIVAQGTEANTTNSWLICVYAQGDATIHECSIKCSGSAAYTMAVYSYGEKNLEIVNSAVFVGCGITGLVAGVYSNNAGTVLVDSKLYSKSSAKGSSVYGLNAVKGEITVSNCDIRANGYGDADVVPDDPSADGIEIYSAHAINTSLSVTSLNINDGYYYGSREALMIHEARTRIDGGVFDGCEHGGAYLCASDIKIKNATFRGYPYYYFQGKSEGPLLDTEYLPDWEEYEYCGACVYCGAQSDAATAIFDNCTFEALGTVGDHITAKYGTNDFPTKVYVSNAVLKGKTYGANLRVDSGCYQYVGCGVTREDGEEVTIEKVPDGSGGSPEVDFETYKDESFAWFEGNQIIGPDSHAEGKDNISGIKGYKMNSVTTNTTNNSAVIGLADADYDEKASVYYRPKDILQFSGATHYNGILQITGVDTNASDGSTLISVMLLSGTITESLDSANKNPNLIYLGLKENEAATPVSDEKENWCWVTEKNYGVPILRHIGAHTEGEGNIAAGRAATASGGDNQAVGDYADAGGLGTVAHYAGFARGAYTNATGRYATATGLANTSSGECAHSSGRNNAASGKTSHVQNESNVASHDYSDVSGFHNHSSRNSQSVVGQYNASNGEALFIVGDGYHEPAEPGSPARDVLRNAFVVTRDGRATIRTNPGSDMDVATKCYVDASVVAAKQHANTAIADAEQRAKQSATKSVVFENENSLFNVVTNGVDVLNSAKWGSGSKNHHYEAPNKWNIENITTEISGISYITGFKVDRVNYQGFYLEIDSSTFGTSGGAITLDFCTSSNIPLSAVRILKANYDDDGTLSSPTYSNEDGKAIDYKDFSYIDFSVTELRNGKSYSIAFEPTGDCDKYHVYFAMGGIAGMSMADSYLIVSPIHINHYPALDSKELNLANCNLNKGDLLLIEEGSSPDYWWTGTLIKPIGGQL